MSVETPIAPVEVSVDERRGDAAGIESRETIREATGERVERQLGYKHAKYLMRIEMKDSFAGLWGGKGGFWEDRGYEWYAGI